MDIDINCYIPNRYEYGVEANKVKTKQLLQKLRNEISESNLSKEAKDLTTQIVNKYERDTAKTVKQK